MTEHSPSPHHLLREIFETLPTSQLFELGDADVITPNVLARMLEAFSAPEIWWDEILSSLEPPPSQTCTHCGQPEYRGQALSQIDLGSRDELPLEVAFLGHYHDDDATRSVHVVYVPQASSIPVQARGLFQSTLSSSATANSGQVESAKALDRLTSASASVDSYLAKLSHELRTPLNVILGYSEMLLEDAEAGARIDRQSVERIHDSGSLLLETIATLEQKIRRERHKRKLSETLRELSSTMAASLDLEDVVHRILDGIAEIIEFDRARILTVDEDKIRTLTDHCLGDWSAPVDAEPASSSETLWRALAAAPESTLVSDLTADSTAADAVHPECHSWLAVPLMSASEPVGLISLESQRPGFYDEFDVDLVTALAHPAAGALLNAQQHTRVRRLAEFDPLTGAFTRGHFFDAGVRACSKAIAQVEPLSVVMLDIDHFKPVNDTFGHAAGDQVLQGVVEQCQSALRSEDLIGRYGGEEFALVLPGVDSTIAVKVAERLRRRIELSEFQAAGNTVSITISLGVAQLRHEPPEALEQLLERADAALYEAKHGGRNRVVPA